MHIKDNTFGFDIYGKLRFICITVAVSFLTSLICMSQTKENKKDKILFADAFENTLDTTFLKVEMVKDSNSSVLVKNGKLIIDTPGGVTI